MCKTSCVPCCGEEKPLIYLEAAARFLQESNNWQFTNKIQIEDDANWAFANFLFYGPANTHTHTHAFTQTHTRRGRHADILYQCVHTPLGPNDAYKMQQQQFSAFFLNGNFFVVAVQQPSPPTICPLFHEFFSRTDLLFSCCYRGEHITWKALFHYSLL